MNLLYLLWMMWPPPHLFSISVGVWCRVSATIDAFLSRLGSGKMTEAGQAGIASYKWQTPSAHATGVCKLTVSHRA